MDEQENGMEISGTEPKDVEALEAELRATLRHVAAPEGFTDRVMARVQQREAERELRARQSRGFGGMYRRVQRNTGVWSSIAAMLLLAAGGNVAYQRHERQERQAVVVQQQMDLAMELTSHALDNVQGGLDRSPAGQFLNGIK